MESIIVFRPGALGDTMLAVDALAALRRRFADAHLELVGHPEAGKLLQAAGLIDRATSFDAAEVTRLFRAPPEIPERWQGPELVVLWLRDAGALPQAFGRAGARVVIAASPEPADAIHASDHLLRTLGPAGVAPTGGLGARGWGLGVGLAGPGASSGAEVLRIPGLTLTGRERAPTLLHPGSGSGRKNWPPDRFAALSRRLILAGLGVEVIEGPADQAAVAGLRARLGQGLRVHRPADGMALAASLLSAQLYVGNDSGVTHLSARLGVPTVAIFGATDPKTWSPRGPRVSVVGDLGIWPSAEAVAAACLRVIGKRAP